MRCAGSVTGIRVDGTTRRRSGFSSSGTNGVGEMTWELGRLFDRAVPVAASMLLAALTVVAVIHLRDLAFVDHQSSPRMGLARYARMGTLYPPLFDGEHYGGTRMMPIPILLHAGLASLTDEYVTSGKLVSSLSFLGLLIVSFAALRRLGCSVARSAVCVAAVATSAVGTWTSLAISYDGLPVAIQMAAVMLVDRIRGRGTAAVAGLLCALAFFTKLSALWAVGAIGAWLWLRNRRVVGAFVGAYVGAFALGFVVFQLASGGRFAENLFLFSSSGVGGDSVLRIGSELWRMVVIAPVLYVLLPLAVIEFMVARRGGDLNVYHLALPFSAGILVLLLTRAGAVSNHFLDLLTVCAVLSGRMWMRWRGDASRFAVIPIALTLGMAASLPMTIGVVGSWGLGGERASVELPFLEGLVDPADRILSEDAAIPIVYGQTPVVLDPFLLTTIGARYPDRIRPLVDRLERGAIDRVILIYSLDDAPDDWYRMEHFGAAIASAIERHYFLLGQADRYFVYAPLRSG